MKARSKVIYTTLLSLCYLQQSLADEPPLPAAFLHHAKEIEKKIRIPATNFGDVIVLRLATLVSRKGKANFVYSYTDETKKDILRPYEKAVINAVKMARLTPAKVNGLAEEVWFNFSAIFTSHSGRPAVKIYPNLLYNVQEYGMDYTDPQRYDLTGRLPKDCWSKKTMVWLLTDVDSTGKTLATRVLKSSNGSDRCKNTLANNMLNSSFIPAQHDGKFVPATHMQAFWHRGSCRLNRLTTLISDCSDNYYNY